MPEPLSETVDTIVEALAVTNLKTVGEMAAWSVAQAMKDHVAHSKRLDILAETYLSRALKSADEVDPEQAAATLKLLTGNDLAQTMSSLGAMVGSLQQMIKGAQTTPPNTAG